MISSQFDLCSNQSPYADHLWGSIGDLFILESLRAISGHINGGGGGSPTMAQGGGSNPDGIPAALDAARELLGL